VFIVLFENFQIHVRGIVIVVRDALVGLFIAAVVVAIAACSDDEPDISSPADQAQFVSEVSSPVDTLVCETGFLLRYEYRGVRVTGDMELSDLDTMLDLVERNLFEDESITGVMRAISPGCYRLPFSTAGSVVAQTSRTAGASDEYQWGRFFSFSRVDGRLILVEVGSWEWPEAGANP